MCSSHTQEGYGLGAEVSVHPARAPSPCRFGSNKGVWGNGPKNKNGVWGGSVGGRRGVPKHWGVVRGGLDEVSTGNAAGEEAVSITFRIDHTAWTPLPISRTSVLTVVMTVVENMECFMNLHVILAQGPC